ncbi:MAG: nicotinate-nucleotide--dimethylbenzimidazole phosphoribosyltransferase [Pseudomonadales bacterium]
MLQWLNEPAAQTSSRAQEAAEARQASLTKPVGSLGVLEDIAIKFAGWQGSSKPELSNVSLRIFAADHGVATEGVSAFPQEVTAQMIGNFLSGGAAVSVLARKLNASFSVVNLGTATPLDDAENLHNLQLAAGSHNFCEQASLGDELLEKCLEAGRQFGAEEDCQLFVAGEMGIGNTTSASAICSAALTLPVEQSVGRGTGITDSVLEQKQKVVRTGLDKHRTSIRTPLGILSHVGGLEIAAMVGAYISAAQKGVPILVDGYICSSAALIACQINPSIRNWMLFAHRSTEPGHQHILTKMDAKPLFDLGLRLGEGSGAALAIPFIQHALALHNEMATFREAAVTAGKNY